MWTNTGLSFTGASGAFSFNPTNGSGIYYFDLVAEDNAGNRSAAASGDGDTITACTALYTVTGRIALGDYVGDITAVSVTVELRKHGGGTDSRVVSLDSSGNFTLDRVEAGMYDIAFKANHWLRKVIPNVQVGP